MSSQEHKTHPGPWGEPRWRRRNPALNPCPTDVAHDAPQRWLDQALAHPLCWDWRDEEPTSGFPPYLCWYDMQSGRFFMAQRLERAPLPAGPCRYKGYPAEPHQVPMAIFNEYRKRLPERVWQELRRARRREIGAKT